MITTVAKLPTADLTPISSNSEPSKPPEYGHNLSKHQLQSPIDHAALRRQDPFYDVRVWKDGDTLDKGELLIRVPGLEPSITDAGNQNLCSNYKYYILGKNADKESVIALLEPQARFTHQRAGKYYSGIQIEDPTKARDLGLGDFVVLPRFEPIYDSNF